MTAAPRTAHDFKGRDPGSPPGRPRRHLGLLVALLASLCAFVLPAAPAFGEGSVDFNTGPAGTAIRHGLTVSPTATPTSRPPLLVYARAGETIQMGNSLMGLGAANIRLFAPGADMATATPLVDCVADQPATGRIGSRAAEIAGPLPNAGGWTPCSFVATADGQYQVNMIAAADVNGTGGSIDSPATDLDTNPAAPRQGWNASIWDVTVRDATQAVRPGRLFTFGQSFQTSSINFTASNTNSYVYTKTGYEFRVNFVNHTGINWTLLADDMGVIDSATGDRIYGSYEVAEFNNDPNPRSDATLAPASRRFPQFFSRVDPIAISGPGGLAETHGISATAIAPSTQPLANLSFSGAAGQAGGTKRGEGGTISFTSPSQLESLGYSVLIDTNRDGTFGNGSDFVDASKELEADGTQAYAWGGRDAAGNVPACGDYQYQIRSSLSEVHFTQSDTENSGGMQIERLTRPTDPDLGSPFAMSYNDIDRYTSEQVTDTVPAARTDFDSRIQPFHNWGGNTGDVALVDTWTKLPEVQASGSLQILCPDVEIVKSSTAPLVAGERGTYKLTMVNHGPGTAVNAKASDKLPSGVSFVSASAGCSQAAGVVTCTDPSLAEGASREFTVTVDVDSSADSCEDVRNTATVTNDTGPDPEPINNTSTICNFERRADLSLSKTESSATVAPGGQVMYTMVARNLGPSDEPNAVVKDPIPEGLTLVSAEAAQGSCSIAGGDLSCNLGSLRSGGSTQILVTATLTATECVTNTARVSGDAFDPKLANNVDDARVCPEVGPPPRFDLVVSKSVNKRNPRVGETVRYRVRVTNRGPDAAPSATVKDTLNAPVRVVSVKASQGSCTKRIPMTCELGTIPAGGRVTITIRAKHREPVSGNCSRRGQRNAASATADGTDTNPANNLDVAKVCPKVELKLTKKVSTGTVRAGQTFTYTIRTHNPAKVAVRNVRTCDRLPAGLVYVSSNPKAKLSKGQHCWTAKAIGAGKSKTYKVTVRALAGANGRLVNTATATSPSTKRVLGKRRVQVIGQQIDPPQPTG